MRGFSWTVGYIHGYFCTTGQVEFGWFSKLLSGIVGTHLPCRQFFAPPNSVRHSSQVQCIIWARVCVWTVVPCTWQQLLLELNPSKPFLSKWHLRLYPHGFSFSWCRNWPVQDQHFSSLVSSGTNPLLADLCRSLGMWQKERSSCNHPRITNLQNCG